MTPRSKAVMRDGPVGHKGQWWEGGGQGLVAAEPLPGTKKEAAS